MKHGTAYAKRVKRMFAQLKKQAPEPRATAPTEPLEQLVLAVLGQDTSPASARRALDLVLQQMVDLNEVRVSSPREIADIIGPVIPDSLACATRLCSILNAVFNLQNTMSLASLHTLGKRDAKRWLEQLDGIEPFHVASVLLWSLGGHAIPISARLMTLLRKEELIDPTASVTEVQSFFERHIAPSDAKTFCQIMEGFTAPRRAAAAKPKTPAARPPKKAAGRAEGKPGRPRRGEATAPQS
jgi:endonuclease III